MPANNTNNQEQLITIQDILFILKSNIIAIIVMAVLGGVIFGAYSRFMIKPEYQSEARMYVLSSADSELIRLSDIELGTQLASDYVEMMLSRPMLEEVIDELSIGDQFTPAILAKHININNPQDTRILNVIVRMSDPELAADVANTLATVSAKNLSDIMETVQPKVFQSAVVNYSKVAPNHATNTMIGIIFGALLSIGLAMFLFITDDTITSEEDIERYVGLANFGVINEGVKNTAKKKNT